MSWIQTYTGKAFYPLTPSEDDVDIGDIAHALSNICRFTGHVSRFYSVAEHSWHISNQFTDPNLAMEALLHDASEAYLTDVARPIKPFLTNYMEIEDRLMKVIFSKYSLIYPFDNKIKELDMRILINERNALMMKPPKDWDTSNDPIPTVHIRGFVPEVAEELFLERFEVLCLSREQTYGIFID